MTLQHKLLGHLSSPRKRPRRAPILCSLPSNIIKHELLVAPLSPGPNILREDTSPSTPSRLPSAYPSAVLGILQPPASPSHDPSLATGPYIRQYPPHSFLNAIRKNLPGQPSDPIRRSIHARHFKPEGRLPLQLQCCRHNPYSHHLRRSLLSSPRSIACRHLRPVHQRWFTVNLCI